MKYLHDNKINAYIPDNKFRSRDPKFSKQKEKYGKRYHVNKKSKTKKGILASEFVFDVIEKNVLVQKENSWGFFKRRVRKMKTIKYFLKED